jgi:hypothetical protein
MNLKHYALEKNNDLYINLNLGLPNLLFPSDEGVDGRVMLR